jgi:quercetin dioxygenase-like cupin family protein
MYDIEAVLGGWVDSGLPAAELEGRLRVTLGDGEPYEVGPHEGSFHPSNMPHKVEALEDTVAISFKNVVDPTGYEATGKLA